MAVGPRQPPQPVGNSEHWVDPEPWQVHREQPLTPEQERYYTASQWRLMWWRFKRHKVALASLWILALFYVVVAIAEVVAP